MSLTEAQYELFERLTERPFLVLDLEYAIADGNEHIVSVAVTPVVRGKRTRDGEIYIEVNPGVPIDAATSAVHGFTDASVKGKRRFPFSAARVLQALSLPDAILVSHTTVDARVLGEELARAETATDGKIVAADLPDLPILDTSTLPRLVQHPVAAGRSVVSLKALCEGLGVTLKDHHNALADTRATADALIELLRHAAAGATCGSIEDLLDAAGAGTARTPRGGRYARRDRSAPAPSRKHLRKHAVEPLTHAGTFEECDAWVARARECVQIRCDVQREEAELAAPHNAGALLPLVAGLITDVTEPGQAGALAAAIRALLTMSAPHVEHEVTSPALGPARVTYWWRDFRPKLYAAPRCSRSKAQACQACWDDTGCVTDLLYQTTTELVVFASGPALTVGSIGDRLVSSGRSGSRVVDRWAPNHPLEAAYVLELICRWADEDGTSFVPYLDIARAKNLEMLEPRLGLRVLNQELPVRGFEHAAGLAQRLLARRNTDPAYAHIESWLALNASAFEEGVRRSKPRVITRPRLARPVDRVPDNPYRLF